MTGAFLVWIERRFQRGPFLLDAVGVETHQPGPSALFAEGYLCVLAVSPVACTVRKKPSGYLGEVRSTVSSQGL